MFMLISFLIGDKPPTFRSFPLPRSARRKNSLKKLRKRDITWDNCSLLAQFVNPAGKLYNRVQTHLKTSIHKRVRRMVCVARWLGLMPSKGSLKPTDKLNLKPLIEEIHRHDLRTIDAKSGVLVFRDPKYSYADMVTKGENMNAYNKSKPYHSNYLTFISEFVKELLMDRDAKAPAFEELIWMKAENHLKKEVSLHISENE